MPIYEYKCPKCRHVFEEWTKSINDMVEEPCPRCGALAHRLISQTSFVLKGGGWYVDDYGYRKGIKEEGEATTATSSGGSGTESPAASSGGSAQVASAAKEATEAPKVASETPASEAKTEAPKSAPVAPKTDTAPKAAPPSPKTSAHAS
ncbi:MAG: zinc ribbon domain-containing protein [Desulfovibrio sp.]|jgi:putative FmdB family regulatory protein|nr:zinc ribbon domain-containing protein [Desulfovibrio sp.]